MMPERILADTRSALPDDAIITTDVGWNKNGVGQQFNILTPGSILTPGGFATMGFGPPAAIGAKLFRFWQKIFSRHFCALSSSFDDEPSAVPGIDGTRSRRAIGCTG